VLQCLEHGVSRCVFVVSADCDLCVPSADFSSSDELWRLSLATLEWTRIEVPGPIADAPGGARPLPRYRHTMTIVGLDLWVHAGQTSWGEDDACATCAARLLVFQ
jgi:hypothetical protein